MKTAIFIAMIIILAQHASAYLFIDQFYTPPSTSVRSSPENVFQSFTCGIDGSLSRIELLLATIDIGDRDSIVTLWDSCATTALGFVSLHPADMPASTLPDMNVWVTFDFEAQGILLNQGSLYNIEFAQGDGSIYSANWDGSEYGTYTGGACSHRDILSGTLFETDADLGFRTFMTPVPEPHTLSLFVVGCLGLLAKRCLTA